MKLPRVFNVFFVAFAGFWLERGNPIPQVMTFHVNDILGKDIFLFVIITLPGSQENEGECALRQRFQYLVYPA
jgi:hypothetical protein